MKQTGYADDTTPFLCGPDKNPFVVFTLTARTLRRQNGIFKSLLPLEKKHLDKKAYCINLVIKWKILGVKEDRNRKFNEHMEDLWGIANQYLHGL